MKKLLLLSLIPTLSFGYMTCQPSRLNVLANNHLAQHTYLGVDCQIEQRWNEPREYRIVIQNNILGKYAGDAVSYGSSSKTFIFTLNPGDKVTKNFGEWVNFIVPSSGYDRYISEVNLTTQSGDTLKATYRGRVDVM